MFKKDGGTLVLLFGFVALILGVPAVFLIKTNSDSKYDEFGILKENEAMFFELLNENSLINNIIDIVCNTKEIT